MIYEIRSGVKTVANNTQSEFYQEIAFAGSGKRIHICGSMIIEQCRQHQSIRVDMIDIKEE